MYITSRHRHPAQAEHFPEQQPRIDGSVAHIGDRLFSRMGNSRCDYRGGVLYCEYVVSDVSWPNSVSGFVLVILTGVILSARQQDIAGMILFKPARPVMKASETGMDIAEIIALIAGMGKFKQGVGRYAMMGIIIIWTGVMRDVCWSRLLLPVFPIVPLQYKW